MLTHFDCFAGLGMFSVGMEATGGFETIGFCESNNWCQQRLARRYPGKYIHSDARTLRTRHFGGYRWPDVFTLGVPCQPSSRAGKQRFTGDERWLWGTALRLVDEFHPRFAVFENPAGLLDGGFGEVIHGLAEIRYDAQWTCLSSAHFVGPTERERLLILAYPASERQPRPWALGSTEYPAPFSYREATDVDDAFSKERLAVCVWKASWVCRRGGRDDGTWEHGRSEPGALDWAADFGGRKRIHGG